jgi:hypothetical protein
MIIVKKDIQSELSGKGDIHWLSVMMIAIIAYNETVISVTAKAEVV